MFSDDLHSSYLAHKEKIHLATTAILSLLFLAASIYCSSQLIEISQLRAGDCIITACARGLDGKHNIATVLFKSPEKTFTCEQEISITCVEASLTYNCWAASGCNIRVSNFKLNQIAAISTFIFICFAGIISLLIYLLVRHGYFDRQENVNLNSIFTEDLVL